MTLTKIIAMCAALLAGALLLADRGGRAAGDRMPEPVATRHAPRPTLRAAANDQAVQLPYHGVAIQIHESDRAAERYGRLIDEVGALGANTVLISVNGYQEDVDSSHITTNPEAMPSDEALVSLFMRARDQGLRVILMPKILLTKPRSGAWRGKIKPPSWDAWFDQYADFILHLADLAERGGVEVFSVGSELVSTEKMTENWESVIERVRSRFHGKLTYSANWDHYTSIQFWDRLDMIGMTTYNKLADEPGPSLDKLRSAWRDIRNKLLDFQAKIGKPLLFTEVGWCSQEGCSVEAWNYYREETATPAGLEEQKRNYEAFIDVWADEPAVIGMIWWEWTEGSGGRADFGYTPKNKPAEAVLRSFFRESARELARKLSANAPQGG